MSELQMVLTTRRALQSYACNVHSSLTLRIHSPRKPAMGGEL